MALFYFPSLYPLIDHAQRATRADDAALRTPHAARYLAAWHDLHALFAFHTADACVKQFDPSGDVTVVASIAPAVSARQHVRDRFDHACTTPGPKAERNQQKGKRVEDATCARARARARP